MTQPKQYQPFAERSRKFKRLVALVVTLDLTSTTELQYNVSNHTTCVTIYPASVIPSFGVSLATKFTANILLVPLIRSAEDALVISIYSIEVHEEFRPLRSSSLC